MVINGIVELPVVNGTITFDKVYFEKDPEAAKTKLYNWMIANGYEVTASMTMSELVDVLVGKINARYYVENGNLYIVDSSAKVENGNLYLYNGARVENGNLYLKDVN